MVSLKFFVLFLLQLAYAETCPEQTPAADDAIFEAAMKEEGPEETALELLQVKKAEAGVNFVFLSLIHGLHLLAIPSSINKYRWSSPVR